MNTIDGIVILIYFIVVVGLGFWYRKRASKNLNSYFLGSNQISWWKLAMSGSVSTFDITGTMWIVSLLIVLGMKSMWIHWMWGVMLGAFCMAYMGKWVRRSNVVTAAEWMVTRFGSSRGGKLARTVYALMAVLMQASFIGYAFQGIGKFASVYIPLPASILAIAIISLTTLYVLLGGLFSVVITDVIQTIILTIAGIFICYLAFSSISASEIQSFLPENWFSLKPVWQIKELAGTEYSIYQMFGALTIVWVLKGLLLNLGGPAQMYDFQRFLAARDTRDAAKVGASWSLFLVVRWGMAAAIALLALSGLTEITDPEKVMPIVIKDFIPIGFRGLIIAGLLAAFMSTFSSTVNSGASYIVKDIWQEYFRPDADENQLVRASYLSTILIVVVGILIGTQATSIAQIWNWMMMALGAGVIIPNVLRWYWWRINGTAYAAGTFTGILASIVVLFNPDSPMYIYFPLIILFSGLVSIGVAYATKPVKKSVLVDFYKKVRPIGFWKPIKDELSKEEREYKKSDSPFLAIVNTLFGIIAITALYLFPMYLVGHQVITALFLFGISAGIIIVLYFTWYKNLPEKGETG